MRDLSNRTHGLAGTYGAGCRCAPCTEATRDQARLYRATVKERDGRSVTQKYRPRKTAAACSQCGAPIRHAFSESPKCRACATKPRPKRRINAERAIVKAARGTRSRMTWTCGVCAECGDPFTVRASVAVTLCSRKCRNSARYRARTSTFKISRRSRLAIYERDGWTCQLCHGPVDGSLHYLDDWSATLDHIECQAWALIPDHSPSNLRLAHRWCNSARGDGTYSNGLFDIPKEVIRHGRSRTTTEGCVEAGAS